MREISLTDCSKVKMAHTEASSHFPSIIPRHEYFISTPPLYTGEPLKPVDAFASDFTHVVRFLLNFCLRLFLSSSIIKTPWADQPEHLQSISRLMLK